MTGKRKSSYLFFYALFLINLDNIGDHKDKSFFKERNYMTEKEEKTVSRRDFLKNTGLVAGGVVGGSLFGGLLTDQFLSKDKTTEQPVPEILTQARVFFSRSEDFAILNAATERIYPEDDHGPGAIELGVPYFIDKQLAGSWGSNAKEYMRDPFLQNKQTFDYQKKSTMQNKSGPNTSTKAPTPTPRYQSRFNRGKMFLYGLRKMEEVSQHKHGAHFVDLDAKEQDEILTSFEKNEVDMQALAPMTFFNLLLQTTIEGVYADPVYGGNKDMMGWKMKEYPGPRMAHINDIESEEFIVMEPES